MSDDNRKSFHTKFFEKATPGIFKSKQEKVKESATDKADTVAREGQPDPTKGPLQETSDKLGRAKDRVVDDAEASTHQTKSFFGRKKKV